MASLVKFGPKVKELRILLSQNADASRGTREFLKKYYATLKLANPQLKFMIREAQGTSPKVYTRYEYGKEAAISLVDNTAEEVLEKIKQLSRS
ncbi:putative nadh-ubiquinone oxidoreductase kDa subunit [Fasciolopsis buskii]|uniref:NADH dehydrogenase [ubiquinone] 1 alpha subcomplex subunit 2 n=1 Tax=Fasciolopsis buskii TaxID=27845 RepID=A0A8E0VNY0_9TREM|nr:putative nadh-ubiquinone oxidoreductase kDa subunit [Fasciolopsis buski]